MHPASQALWDKDCFAAVTEATEDVSKMEERCLQQIQFRSPKTLIFPLPLKITVGSREMPIRTGSLHTTVWHIAEVIEDII